jgi:hypothetical protein
MKYLIAVVILMSLSACGKDGARGPAGADGQSIIGPQGVPGLPGTNGTNASPITVVQFCQSCVTHYPDTFAEIGFCSNGSIFGTYSANDGFSAEIVPGVYSSKGINCSCTFTVSANCAVSN